MIEYTGWHRLSKTPPPENGDRPQCSMLFGGIADATERANLIAYLRTLAAEPAPVAFVAP